MKGEVSRLGSSTFDGYGVGVGLRSMINSKFYVQAEVNEIDYSSQSFNGLNVDPKQISGTIGVGYKFSLTDY